MATRNVVSAYQNAKGDERVQILLSRDTATELDELFSRVDPGDLTEDLIQLGIKLTEALGK